MVDKGVRIRIVSESVGKGFKDADKSLNKLKKAVGALGLSVSAASIVKFGKDSAKAFMDDQKAASQLALSVKNLGLAFETPAIEQFISQLSKASGVTDEMLRPSMQKLLQTTGSVKKSTELLTQALDISRGSGVDYETVVSDLSAAYLGQTKGLSKYSLGLTKAELKTMSFADIQAKLTDQFKGGNAAYLETYAGKMQLLATAAGEAQEIIGKSLVDALGLLSGEGNTVQPLADAMNNLATYTGDVITGLATMIAKFKELPGVTQYLDFYFNKVLPFQYKGLTDVLDYIKGFAPVAGMGGYPSSALGPGYIDPNEAARKKAEADALKRAKALAALQAKALAETKKKVALEKAARTLEIDRINITAGLKSKISETDRLSLNLQLALLDKNDAQATKLSGELTAAIKRQNELNAALLATPEAPNPYRNWVAPGMAPITTQGSISSGGGGIMPDFNVPANSYGQVGPMGGLGAGVIAGVNPPVNVTVTIDGKELTSIITDTQINNSLSGSFNQVNRGNFKGAVAT
jgi:hypothetical protein